MAKQPSCDAARPERPRPRRSWSSPAASQRKRRRRESANTTAAAHSGKGGSRKETVHGPEQRATYIADMHASHGPLACRTAHAVRSHRLPVDLRAPRSVLQSNPLSLDSPSDSFVPGGSADAADASAAASSTPAAAASSGAPLSNKAAKAAARAASTAGAPTVLYGAIRKFSELPISQRTLKALTEANFVRLTDIQRASIPHALAGRDILGAARTGSGKTLAYLVPVLERLYRERWDKQAGVGALIIVPTRELAMQIFDVLRSSVGKTHIYSAGLIIGGKDLSEEQERIGGMNILICTPGRILQHFEQTYGFGCPNLQMLVLDEADRILDMGFQQTMRDIISYLPGERQTLLFSATQTRNLKQLAQLSLRNPEYIAVHESTATALPNKLVQHYTIIPAEQKLNLLYSFIKTHLTVKSIVFVSSGKQVRFLYEGFRRIRPGVPLLHIHGKMKQAKRMAIYYDFCNKTNALLFCTDLAARGLDFPDVDWVVQMDAPENVPTYIHRVGRTARYRSGGKSLLFLLPSEQKAFMEQLGKKVDNITRVKADAAKMKDVTPQFAAFLAENSELKFLAQKAFISYVRSVSLQADKEVFDASAIPFDALAKSMGLPGTPKVKLPKAGSAAASAASAAQKEKNMPHQLRQLLAEKVDPSLRKSKRKGDEPLKTAVEKILTRKNATVFSKAREALRAEDEESEEEEIMTVRRKDHDLSSEDSSDEEGMELSSESGEDDEEDEDEEEEAEGEEGKPAKKSSKALLRAELSARIARAQSGADGPAPKSVADATGDESFLALAAARVREQDPTDRATDAARVRAKHLAKKIALKKAKRAQEREDAAGGSDEDDDEEEGEGGMVVTLGRPDGEEEGSEEEQDEGEDEQASSGEEEQSADEQEDEEEEEEEEAPSSKKRKGPAPSTAAAGKKQKTQSIADQEALALKILGLA